MREEIVSTIVKVDKTIHDTVVNDEHRSKPWLTHCLSGAFRTIDSV
jgi:hypothetical protein